ncbi:MAG: hypothetical protein ACOWWM_09570 [Desulfobacterales bacterium]
MAAPAKKREQLRGGTTLDVLAYQLQQVTKQIEAIRQGLDAYRIQEQGPKRPPVTKVVLMKNGKKIR